MKKVIIIVIMLSFAVLNNTYSQNVDSDSTKTEQTSLFKDSVDGKLDMSKWLLKEGGFFPLVQIVTEPSLGGIGILFLPIFIQKNEPVSKGEYAPPNLTVGAASYTANNTWALGAMRIVHNQKYGINYRYGAAYADINMDFYRVLPHLGEKKFSFNFQTVPIYGNILKEFGDSHFYAGVEWIFAKTKVNPVFDINNPTIDDFLNKILNEKDIESTISSFGTILQYDTRDNLFTPNKGFYAELDLRFNDKWTGSDYKFQNAHLVMFKYFHFTEKWVSSYRLDAEFLFGDDTPFYVHPGINLRGVPMARYQGLEAYTIETEQRYDFNLRWSGVVFGGLAKAVDANTNFNDALLVHNYGAGFRYLISRIFGIRLGVDVAKSNNDWGYYITFGSAWKR